MLTATDVREVPVAGSDRPALVDAQDSNLVLGLTWWLDPQGGASTSIYRDGVKRNVPMHRIVLGLSDPSVHGDHRNHDRLDNRRENLRSCSHGDNMMNQQPRGTGFSIYKGVTRVLPHVHRTKPWQASISARGKRHHLGYFYFERDAVLAYNAAAKELHGDFACLNEVPDE